MLNHTKCKELARTARNAAAGKPLANNTRIVARGDCFAVRLHNTDILTFEPDGSTVYNSGGWRTVTTKARMNEYGPARIGQEAGAWYINGKPYLDGCRVTKGGRVIGAGRLSDITKDKRLRLAVNKYAKDYTAALYAGTIPAPSNGDCWGCLMVTAKGETPIGGKDHILDHIKERYFVPSLAWRAVTRGGCGDAYKRELAGLMNMPGRFITEDWKPFGGFVKDTIQRTIRKHCLRELGMAA